MNIHYCAVYIFAAVYASSSNIMIYNIYEYIYRTTTHHGSTAYHGGSNSNSPILVPYSAAARAVASAKCQRGARRLRAARRPAAAPRTQYRQCARLALAPAQERRRGPGAGGTVGVGVGADTRHGAKRFSNLRFTIGELSANIAIEWSELSSTWPSSDSARARMRRADQLHAPARAWPSWSSDRTHDFIRQQ